jgi:hypothetical protein
MIIALPSPNMSSSPSSSVTGCVGLKRGLPLPSGHEDHGAVCATVQLVKDESQLLADKGIERTERFVHAEPGGVYQRSA